MTTATPRAGGIAEARDPAALMTAKEVCRLLNISQAKLERLKAAEELPPPVVFGRRCHRYRRGDITAFVEARLAGGPGR